jgi:LmbE family N-acetylglucosaminyl deacetylase
MGNKSGMTTKSILVVSPHPDDETHGMGGTIFKLKKQGYNIHLLIISFGEKSRHPVYTEEKLKEVRKKEVLIASKKLGINSVKFAGLPDTEVSKEASYNVIKQAIRELKPERIYLPSNPDRHQDHLNVAQAGILAALQDDVKGIFCYEPFRELEAVTYYEDISEFLEKKLEVWEIFQSQLIKDFFGADKVKARAIVRGSEISRKAAEAFKIVRMVS